MDSYFDKYLLIQIQEEEMSEQHLSPMDSLNKTHRIPLTLQLLHPLLLLLLLSHFSRVQLCVTTETVALQAPPSLGFSRQEHEWVAISFSNA